MEKHTDTQELDQMVYSALLSVVDVETKLEVQMAFAVY